MKNKSDGLRKAFNMYCQEHPELRFWQALRNFSGHNFLMVADELNIENPDIFHGCTDTFFFEERTK